MWMGAVGESLGSNRLTSYKIWFIIIDIQMTICSKKLQKCYVCNMAHTQRSVAISIITCLLAILFANVNFCECMGEL